MAILDDNFDFEQDGKTYNLYNLPDGFVIEGDVYLSYKELTELPDFSKVTVERDFYCNNNKLTTLQGAPQEVGGGFYCGDNQLTTLEGAPQKVGGVFRCVNNQLTSLEGAPQEVGGDFVCYYNKLTSLTGAPREVGGGFSCYNNQLTSLQGAPQKVGGKFDCGYNQLTSLEGAPQEVGGNFWCNNNQLTSLTGAPQKVGGYFSCENNQLTSLQGAPRVVGGDFNCDKNDNLFSLFGLPQMSGDKKIYCDDDLKERYNCPKAENEDGNYYIDYKDLIESAKYQSELSLYKILQKKHEERAQNDTARKEKLKAGFEAFMKMQTEERE